MSRHRRQASLVLPPELIAGNEPAKPSGMGQTTAGVLAGHGATGAAASVSTDQRSTDPHTANQQDSVTHCQDTAKKPPAGKAA
jgi:hypothetical protein